MVSPLILSLKKRKRFYGSRVKILSPAKINLYLNITGKYPGGYRRIESIVERVSLCDEITVEVAGSAGIRILSNCRSLQRQDNLCVKAAELVNNKFKLPWGYNIFLNKKIPVGAGLGGGSSNAASVIIALNTILNLGMDKQKLYALGSNLGSDVNFFLAQSRYAFIYGRGEYVEPFDAAAYKHFIIWPRINLSTKKVYEKTRVKLTNFLCNVKILKYALTKGDIALVKKNIFNVLERSACSISAKLRKVKAYLDDRKVFAKVSGSGSALYTVSNGHSPQIIDGFLDKNCLIFEVNTF